MRSSDSIGVFDSGLGGLTVVKALIRQLPNESIVYFGDTARVPYGTKSRESIIKFSQENTEALLKQDVKMVVVACNSSSSYAIEHLRKTFSVPIIGVIHPGAQEAINITRNNRIGVIATTATKNSGSYEKILRDYNNKVRIFSQACPLFVPLVEEGWFNKKITLDVVREYLSPLKKKNVDTLILGCTHYPLLKTAIKKIVGKDVNLIDSAKAVGRKVKGILEGQQMQRKVQGEPKHAFFVSDRPQEFEKIARKFLTVPGKYKTFLSAIKVAQVGINTNSIK